MALTQVDSDGGGLATIDIWPSTRVAFSDGNSVFTSAPKGIFRMANNEATGWDETAGQIFGFGFSAVEAQPTS